MRAGDVQRFFDEYLEAFATCGRTDGADTRALLAFYGVPLALAVGPEATVLASDEEVVEAAQSQVDGMRAAGYDHTETLSAEIEVLSPAAALYRGSFARRRADGGEIARLAATYLILDGPAGLRIAALLVHDAAP